MLGHRELAGSGAEETAWTPWTATVAPYHRDRIGWGADLFFRGGQRP